MFPLRVDGHPSQYVFRRRLHRRITTRFKLPVQHIDRQPRKPRQASFPPLS